MKGVPEEVSREHMEKCNKCPKRKFAARVYDMHFDWLDCWYDCPNDYEHYKLKDRKKETML
jgi:hypothetical protein